MNRIYTAAILLIISASISCNKPQSKGVTTIVTSDTLFKFVNLMPEAVTLDIYKSHADYNGNTNVVHSLTLPPNGQATIPLRLLDTSVTYYYDYYSADFTFTNWGRDDFFLCSAKFGQFGQMRFQLPSYPMSQLRPAFLKGNNASTTWQAIDFFDGGYSEAWSTLSANDKYKVLVINKSMSFQLYHKNVSGSIITDTITNIGPFSSSDGSCGYYLHYIDGSTDILYNSSSPQAAFPQKPSVDTILLADQVGYWTMVRQ